jgi:hypothetical protein
MEEFIMDNFISTFIDYCDNMKIVTETAKFTLKQGTSNVVNGYVITEKDIKEHVLKYHSYPTLKNLRSSKVRKSSYFTDFLSRNIDHLSLNIMAVIYGNKEIIAEYMENEYDTREKLSLVGKRKEIIGYVLTDNESIPTEYLHVVVGFTSSKKQIYFVTAYPITEEDYYKFLNM